MEGAEYNHKFSDACSFDAGYSRLVCQLPELHPIAQSFIRNMNRVHSLGILPINLVASALVNEAARVEALVNRGVPIHDPRIIFGHQEFDKKVFDEVDAERMRLV